MQSGMRIRRRQKELKKRQAAQSGAAHAAPDRAVQPSPQHTASPSYRPPLSPPPVRHPKPSGSSSARALPGILGAFLILLLIGVAVGSGSDDSDSGSTRRGSQSSYNPGSSTPSTRTASSSGVSAIRSTPMTARSSYAGGSSYAGSGGLRTCPDYLEDRGSFFAGLDWEYDPSMDGDGDGISCE